MKIQMISMVFAAAMILAAACADRPTEPAAIDATFKKTVPVTHLDVDIKQFRASKKSGVRTVTAVIINQSVIPCPDATVNVRFQAYDAATIPKPALTWFDLCDEPGGGGVKTPGVLVEPPYDSYIGVYFEDGDPDTDTAVLRF